MDVWCPNVLSSCWPVLCPPLLTQLFFSRRCTVPWSSIPLQWTEGCLRRPFCKDICPSFHPLKEVFVGNNNLSMHRRTHTLSRFFFHCHCPSWCMTVSFFMTITLWPITSVEKDTIILRNLKEHCQWIWVFFGVWLLVSKKKEEESICTYYTFVFTLWTNAHWMYHLVVVIITTRLAIFILFSDLGFLFCYCYCYLIIETWSLLPLSSERCGVCLVVSLWNIIPGTILHFVLQANDRNQLWVGY